MISCQNTKNGSRNEPKALKREGLLVNWRMLMSDADAAYRKPSTNTTCATQIHISSPLPNGRRTASPVAYCVVVLVFSCALSDRFRVAFLPALYRHAILPLRVSLEKAPCNVSIFHVRRYDSIYSSSRRVSDSFVRTPFLPSQIHQSINPIVSSIIAAKVFVSRCLPLVTGGNCAILSRNSSDFWIAGVRSL